MNNDIPESIVFPPHPEPITLESGPFAGKTFTFAGAIVLNDYPEELALIEKALDAMFGIGDGMWSDESTISDVADSNEVAELSRVLGVPVEIHDSFPEVCRKLREVKK